MILSSMSFPHQKQQALTPPTSSLPFITGTFKKMLLPHLHLHVSFLWLKFNFMPRQAKKKTSKKSCLLFIFIFLLLNQISIKPRTPKAQLSDRALADWIGSNLWTNMICSKESLKLSHISWSSFGFDLDWKLQCVFVRYLLAGLPLTALIQKY